MIPKNNNLYALEKTSCRHAGFLKRNSCTKNISFPAAPATHPVISFFRITKPLCLSLCEGFFFFSFPFFLIYTLITPLFIIYFFFQAPPAMDPVVQWSVQWPDDITILSRAGVQWLSRATPDVCSA